jgi:hypothetical protein
MKNINTQRKIESDIRIFNDLLSTVLEFWNPEDIGVEETNIHLGRFSTISILKYPGKSKNNFFGTNDKNWTSDLYCKMMFNSCDKYGELYC